MQISFRLFTVDDLPEFRAWFADAELSRRLSFPTDEWFAYVTAGGAARSWVALDADRMIAQMQVDREDAERGYLDLAMRPHLRGRGLGAAVLAAFLSGPGRAYPILEGRIEPDNAASLACCRRCGFVILPEPDADGFIQAVYRSSQTS
ncbi:GNAT family N-acetyltransferase [Mesorhizobium australafricanum]|uniref:GNAT family N-acetyltransferase n=1 Tax=Mesorhizobium australafricanum TaxID=3072311 RepID=A0ABU4X896_9HYPH|nr:GNAT family N-acetyltransferase [Mesorhizobium sp. VK3E]MDX8443495.1 GNAT family N-acetyltransferase [Mesorhizobium sp. VK3E]